MVRWDCQGAIAREAGRLGNVAGLHIVAGNGERLRQRAPRLKHAGKIKLLYF